VQQNEYERAKENDELEEAIHIKKVAPPLLVLVSVLVLVFARP